MLMRMFILSIRLYWTKALVSLLVLPPRVACRKLRRTSRCSGTCSAYSSNRRPIVLKELSSQGGEFKMGHVQIIVVNVVTTDTATIPIIFVTSMMVLLLFVRRPSLSFRSLRRP
jgi:hypothetical protein